MFDDDMRKVGRLKLYNKHPIYWFSTSGFFGKTAMSLNALMQGSAETVFRTN